MYLTGPKNMPGSLHYQENFILNYLCHKVPLFKRLKQSMHSDSDISELRLSTLVFELLNDLAPSFCMIFAMTEEFQTSYK